MRQSSSALGHHLDQVSETQLEPQIPPHAEDDDLPVEMAASEEIFNTQHMGIGPLLSAFAGKYAPLPRFAPEPYGPGSSRERPYDKGDASDDTT